jgi:(p)ppGpp synthase/HD superfamily hydrolase
VNPVDTAMLIALEAHGGTRNKHDGEMYSKHLARVWMNVRDHGGGDVQQAIAWLHDTLEDTDVTPSLLRGGLRSGGMPWYDADRIVSGVLGMTKQKGESNEDYYHRCRTNEDSRFVKLRGDMVDNFRRNHQIADEATRLRMARKYSLGMDILS